MTTSETHVAVLRAGRGASRATAGRAGLAYAGNRLVGLVLSLAVLVIATFLIVPLLPGDPATAILGSKATPAAVAALRAQLGLDAPTYVQFGRYVAGLFHGDLGTSFRLHIPVTEIIATKLPYTLSLALGAIVVVLLISVPVGITIGVLTRGGRRPGLAVGFGAVTGLFASIPGYVLGTLLVLVFAVTLKVLPPGGATSSSSAILPTIALALGPAAAVARVVRQETHTIVGEDYMRTARSHRLRAARLYLVHALPNLLTSTLTLTGLILAGIIGGTVIIENVFNYPGIGSAIVQAIIYKDYPVVQGIILVIGTIAIVLNLAIDVILVMLDPRTLRSHARG